MLSAALSWMKTEVNCLFSVWHQRLTAALWALIHSDYHSSQAISVNITLKCILDVKQASPGKTIYDSMWSAAKWAKHFPQRATDPGYHVFKRLLFLTQFISLSFCWFSKTEQTQKYYTLSLSRPAVTVREGRSFLPVLQMGSRWHRLRLNGNAIR